MTTLQAQPRPKPPRDSASRGNWLTVADAAAQIFQRTDQTVAGRMADENRVRRWLRSGKLRGKKLGELWLVDTDDPLINKERNDDAEY